MLSKEIYVGDRLLQKQAPRNYLTKLPNPNISYAHYYRTDDHMPIVDRAIWNQVQARRKQSCNERSAGLNRKANAHFLYGFVYCAECGAPYKRRTIKGRDGVSFKMWNCSERQKGSKGNGCGSPMIRENALLKALSDSLRLGAGTDTDMTEETIPADRLAIIQRIEVGKNGMKILRRETA